MRKPTIVTEKKNEEVEDKSKVVTVIKQERRNMQAIKGKVDKYDAFTTIEEQLKYSEYLLESKLLPPAVNTPEKVVMIINLGRELGLTPIVSLTNIHVIENRPCLNVHLVSALIRKAGFRYEITEDFVPMTSDKESAVSKDANKESTKATYRRTSIKFYENWNGKLLESTISFSTKEAEAQGLLTRTQWQRMPKIMTRTRALVLGCRFVAPDALLGLYEISEAADIAGKDITLDDDGNVISIND